MYNSFLQLTGAQGRIPTKLHASLCIQLLDKGNNREKKDDCFWDYGFVLKQYGVLWGFKEIFPSSIFHSLYLNKQSKIIHKVLKRDTLWIHIKSILTQNPKQNSQK